jgi:DNA-binding protein H-NS
MANINLDKMSLKDLVDLEQRLKKAIAGARERDRSEARQRAQEVAESYGFSVTELFGKMKGARGKSNGAAAKYENPDNRSETWAGRGRKPNWLVAKLSKGAKLEDFAV